MKTHALIFFGIVMMFLSCKKDKAQSNSCEVTSSCDSDHSDPDHVI